MKKARITKSKLGAGLACLTVLAASPVYAGPLNTLDPQTDWFEVARGGDFLFPGQRIVSYGCYYHADMQYDGNFVLYRGPGTGTPIWSTQSSPNQVQTQLVASCSPVPGCYCGNQPGCGNLNGCATPGACCSCTANQVLTYRQDFKYVQMQADGKAVLASRSWRRNVGNLIETIWTAGGGDSSFTGRYLTVEQAGNMIIRNFNGSWFWSTNTGGNPGPVTVPCNIPSQKTKVYGWHDMPGNDYEYTTQPTWQECANRCAQSGGVCKAFTAGINGGGCWLKSAAPVFRNHNLNYYSGVIVNGTN